MEIKHLEKLKSIDYFKEQDFPCIVREMREAPSNTVIAMHGHEFSELVVVASGSLNHIHARGTSRLFAGDFFVIHPDERHGYAELAAGTSVFNLLYHSDKPPLALQFGGFPLTATLFPVVPSQVKASTLGRISRKELPHVIDLVKAIRRESKLNRPFHDAICASLFAVVLLHLSRAMGTVPSVSPSPIHKELDYIMKNLDRKITLKELCAVSGHSISTLFRKFRMATGKSPYDCILAMRAAKAQTLMKSSIGVSLSEASRRTGFCNGAHLSRTLRAYGLKY